MILAQSAASEPPCGPGAIAAGPLRAAIGPRLVPFATSPFPYRGKLPTEDKPFLDTVQGSRYGHSSPRGSLYWEDETYNDRRTLLYLPRGFDPSRPALIVVFFHGNQAELARDVYHRQRVPQQLAASGLNAVLVAPQFAVDALDSSAGHFWERGAFRRYLGEAARRLAELYGDRCAEAAFDRMKIVLVAYSGGYNPAGYALKFGEAEARLHGVALFDALYGETEKFDQWIRERGPAFFFSAYSASSQGENLALQHSLAKRHVAIKVFAKPPARLRLRRGSVTFLAAGADLAHNDFMTEAWVASPLTAMLAGIDGFRLPPRRRSRR